MNTNTHSDNVRESHKNLFKVFLKEVQLWSKTGKEPKNGNHDLNYYLELQENRLKKHNLKLDVSFKPDGEFCSSSRILSQIPVVNSTDVFSRFQQSTYFQSVNQTTAYYRGNQKIYNKTGCLSMYQIIEDPDPEDRNAGSTSYVCPNCGAISTLDTLQQEGCPYCGMHFLMKDLYPKVSNYYVWILVVFLISRTRLIRGEYWLAVLFLHCSRPYGFYCLKTIFRFLRSYLHPFLWAYLVPLSRISLHLCYFLSLRFLKPENL